MRAFIPVAMMLAAVPLAAASASQDNQTVVVTSERRLCTRIELRGASRISYQRVCKTPTEWRAQLGPDWRQLLNGETRSVEDDMDNLGTLTRTGPGGTGALGGGRRRGGP